LKVRFSELFELQLQALTPSLADQILRALSWHLERQPNSGQVVQGTPLRVWSVFPEDGFAYLAFYRLDGQEVVVERLRKQSTPLSPKSLGLED
jgi:hypothetical protein